VADGRLSGRLARRRPRPWRAALLLALAAPLRAPAADDPALAAFLARLRPALRAGDAGAVADLTRFPFLYESAPRDRDAFVRTVFPALFDEPVRRCLADRDPVREGDRWAVFCGPYAFYFGTTADGIRLLEFGADPEAEL
jgi:hypothetical protein